MNDLKVESLLGQTISTVRLKKYATVGFDYILLVMSSGQRLAFVVDEMPLGRYETYTLATITEDRLTDKELEVGLKVEEILILEREEWLLTIEQMPELIGNNPSQIKYGPIGMAPAQSDDVVTTICGLRFSFGNTQHSLLIYVDQYPGLVNLAYPDDQCWEFYSLATVSRRITGHN